MVGLLGCVEDFLGRPWTRLASRIPLQVARADVGVAGCPWVAWPTAEHPGAPPFSGRRSVGAKTRPTIGSRHHQHQAICRRPDSRECPMPLRWDAGSGELRTQNLLRITASYSPGANRYVMVSPYGPPIRPLSWSTGVPSSKKSTTSGET